MTLPEARAGVQDVDLSESTVFVTGATSGIGRETALALARLGATVHIHGRDEEDGLSVRDDLRDLGSESVFYRADFASRSAVRDLAADVAGRVDELDVLVNNAGAHFDEGHLVWDGAEATFAVNHLAPFVLTHDLREVLAADGRVVTTASEVHRRASASEFENVQSVEDYDGFDAYARSKLANVMFTAGLARRLDDQTANCFHPGFVPGSGLWRNAPLLVRAGTRLAYVLPAALTGGVTDTSRSAARNAVYLAASPDVADVTGAYFDDCERTPPSSAASDVLAQRDLWAKSEELAGVRWS
ncbi:SDR family NAD(P)-dependent oxidoreductase [Halobacterium zhouii]|uniref:SDR family NAD(P)-dependent oxidoreductase n=1 Tax=Halobacterium zhouii TaxID=2902624 RepID=UPI001E537F7A|nr:SDR family NAD(P)-dependent oxidoreductase [Halobacterium zhouii]